MNEIKEIHKKLVDVGTYAEQINLLTFVERGNVYNFLKNSDKRWGCCRDVCDQLGIMS